MINNVIEKLTTMFIKFPGIGPRQARRFVYFLLKQDETSLNNLSQTIKDLKKNTAQCPDCLRFFTRQSDDEKSLCEICLDPDRTTNQLMIIEKDADLEVVRKADEYDGRFFVLGGLVPILEKEPAQKIRLKELMTYLENKKPKEVILALSVNPEGDHTAEFLKNTLAPLFKKLETKLTVLGRGLSTGIELEYSDTDTLANALKNRQ